MQNSFDPTEINLLANVVERACAQLGGCDDITREWIAARILARVSDGERNFEALLSLALSVSKTGVEHGAWCKTL
jgi:hypothetical protein